MVNAGEDRVSGESENRGIGVQGAQPAKRNPGQAHVELPVGQLQRDENASRHGDQAPHQGCDDELSYDLVVIRKCFNVLCSGTHQSFLSSELSRSILWAGVSRSSYWPFEAAQIKAVTNTAASSS